jgi:hypothetical protein
MARTTNKASNARLTALIPRWTRMTALRITPEESDAVSGVLSRTLDEFGVP